MVRTEIQRARWSPAFDRALVVVLWLAAIGCGWVVGLAAVVAAGSWLLGRRATTRRWPVLVGLAAGAVAVAVRWIVDDRQLLSGVAATALLALASIVSFEIGRLMADRVAYREQGWQLAAALDGRELAVTDAVRATERARIAGEMHDSLGHDLALLTMQIAAVQVQLAGSATGRSGVVTQLSELRASAASATERLHDIIGVLEKNDEAAAKVTADSTTDSVTTVARLVDRARAAGLQVDDAIDAAELDGCSPLVRSTVHRVLEEVLTNAAKHAPDEQLSLTLTVTDGRITLSAVNPQPVDAVRGPGSGRGLAALAERIQLLGGTFQHGVDEGSFALQARLPQNPRLGAGLAAQREVGDRMVTTEQTRARAAARGGLGNVVLAAAAVLVAASVVLATAFVVVNLGSVLPRERYAMITTGQSQESVESLLPTFQMPEAPQTVTEPTADCRYYEQRISFFERVTTFQICFADGVVAGATEVPAERSR